VALLSGLSDLFEVRTTPVIDSGEGIERRRQVSE
jgi:hypothetical protein